MLLGTIQQILTTLFYEWIRKYDIEYLELVFTENTREFYILNSYKISIL